MFVKLTAEAIIDIHDQTLSDYGGIEGIKDRGFIELLADKPFLSVFGEEQYPTLYLKAAVLFQGLATAHAFNDANKRTAFASCAVFMYLNGYTIEASSDEIIDVCLRIANSQSDRHMGTTEIAEWLTIVCCPIN
ncbi:type II toxin-antitoxin system death-on-curing family toxin [Paenibacillus sp. CF384]|uniref:type II toxin-antitoxin system death-on-curing family toxin n=1 Tax=Paenibacillus sp. CF384 TaxID=1884382 RepID=UPI0008984314|nr:type II toxin-antitoxin system death-on-curing family toxin [Paenibacillus sp. CF384]SDX98899.1 death on curing protein [Paenibacillus sp. CF384]